VKNCLFSNSIDLDYINLHNGDLELPATKHGQIGLLWVT